MPEFGTWFAALIESKEWSIREFAKQAKNVSHTQIADIIKGEATPNPAHAAWWGHLLGLQGDDLTRFIEAARFERAKGKSDSIDWLEVVEKRQQSNARHIHGAILRLRSASALLRALANAAKLGQQPSGQLLESIAKFEESLSQFVDEVGIADDT